MKGKRVENLFKVVRATVLAIAVIVVGSSAYEIEVSAGSSDFVSDNQLSGDGLNVSVWSMPDSDIAVENGKIIFSAESTAGARLITRRAATASDYHDELLNADFTMKLKRLQEGEKFIVAFGLASIESYNEEAGSLEIIFENKSGLKVGVQAYDESGEIISLVDPMSINVSLGQDMDMNVNITSDMALKVTVNNKTYCNVKSPIDLSGRTGLMQTGACEVEVSMVKIVSHQYERPQNINFNEDFESGSININAVTSSMLGSCGYYPAGVHVEEHDGNQVLMFSNVGLGYFGTLYQYSNFELTFDIPYIQYYDLLREDGTVQRPYNMGFVVAIAGETADYIDYGYETAGDAILFEGNSLGRLKGGDMISFEDKNYGNVEKNQGYSVKISVIDTQVTVSLKSLDGNKYDEVLSYKMGNETPTGYVAILTTGQANFSIDNFSIVNKDKDANLMETQYKAYAVEGAEDWEYQPMVKKYLKAEETESAFEWAVMTGVAAIVGVIIVVVCLIVARVKKEGGTKSEA